VDQTIGGGAGSGKCTSCGQYPNACACFKESVLPVDPETCTHPDLYLTPAQQTDMTCQRCGIDVLKQARDREHRATQEAIAQLRRELDDARDKLAALPRAMSIVSKLRDELERALIELHTPTKVTLGDDTLDLIGITWVQLNVGIDADPKTAQSLCEILRSVRNSALDAATDRLRLVVSGLPTCQSLVKHHDASDGKECDRTATNQVHTWRMCDYHAEMTALRGSSNVSPPVVDLPWATVVREIQAWTDEDRRS